MFGRGWFLGGGSGRIEMVPFSEVSKVAPIRYLDTNRLDFISHCPNTGDKYS